MNKPQLTMIAALGLVIGSTRTIHAADPRPLEIRGDLLRTHLDRIETARQHAAAARQAEIEFWAQAGKYPETVFIPEDVKKRAAESQERAKHLRDGLRLLVPRPPSTSP